MITLEQSKRKKTIKGIVTWAEKSDEGEYLHLLSYKTIVPYCAYKAKLYRLRYDFSEEGCRVGKTPIRVGSHIKIKVDGNTDCITRKNITEHTPAIVDPATLDPTTFILHPWGSIGLLILAILLQITITIN